MHIFRYIGPLALLIAMTACSTQRTESLIKNDPGVISFMEAADCVMVLLKEGKLPGFSKDDHGIIRSPGMEVNGSSKLEYPREASMQVEKAGQKDAIYWFVLIRERQDSTWEVVEAWKTDSRGQNRENLIERR